MDRMEIVNQVLRELERTLSAVSERDSEAFAEAMLKARRIFVAGAGRSGLATRAFAMRLMHLGLPAFVVGETTTPGIAAGDLLCIGSGSGETASLVGMAEKAKAIGASVALVTIFPRSRIGALADVVVEIPASTPKATGGERKSIQPMGSLFEQCLLLFLDITVMTLMAKLGMTSERMFERHANLE